MSRLLAIDCSAGACSVALAEEGEIRAAARLRLTRGHSEVILPMVERVLAEAGCTADSLDAVAATVGPGSFTGLRIGLAAARGLALAVGARTVPVTSLEALAHAAGPADTPLLAALDSKRGDLFCQWFDGAGRPVDVPSVRLAADAVALAPAPAFRSAGDAADAVTDAAAPAGKTVTVEADCEVPDAVSVAAVAAVRLAAGGEGPLRPLYLRAPAVNLPAS
ncbi:tRNA (adenosine(37)-N6)-threonylcarbamoyltransferase complex dimerization subunit type 1 TsaB [Thalassobaculum sp. OXR-137]|uniref:tRNA (adenosine(37)-N6)-threonylcarbamoyltransferase complex dimerization subunit type 1 TsaB n=1 Tax=Thalassobaculum sp. OXR-137 TaxID=3100173 RepID=UPI002AC99530|nr:tRNA (adenosine(37)-N6)-threonylcarbamoyltransferase complex dimerization subunit type 1 TsaB [Thalassobaculum sp. OXR-137]WPZ35587.1 tRNA (adenosine(37)-N6)-threonylcarbamoyltransferase complex dimerization subunit type 1 TsaB [Thalassobaculum sp. OXR-137]